MQSKKLFSDFTIVKKDLTRYAPLWCGLSAVLALVYISIWESYGRYGVSEMPYFPFSICFAPVSALAVFGYLHNHTESCAVHALPIRRERLFLLHTVSAFLMYIVPTAVFLIAVDPYYTNSMISMLLWSALDFLWLFSMAVLCMMVTGRKIGAALLYIFIQVLPLLIGTMVERVYLPQLPGVYVSRDVFLTSPMILISSIADSITNGVLPPEEVGELLIMVVLTLVNYAICMVLYGRRHMERSGDLLSVKWLDPVFAACSGATGAITIGMLFTSNSESFDSAMFILGLAIGYLSYWMLSMKSAKVFTPKIIGGLLALAAVLVGSVYVTGMDPFGRVTYLPEVEEVKTATVSQNYYNYNQYETSDPERIAALVELHPKMLEDHVSTSDLGYSIAQQTIHITYELKGGKVIRREYMIYNQDLLDQLSWYFSQPIAKFGTEDPKLGVMQAEYDGAYVYLNREQRTELLNLVLEECRAGNMHVFRNETESKWHIILTDSDSNSYYLNVPLKASALIEWLNTNLDTE